MHIYRRLTVTIVAGACAPQRGWTADVGVLRRYIMEGAERSPDSADPGTLSCMPLSSLLPGAAIRSPAAPPPPGSPPSPLPLLKSEKEEYPRGEHSPQDSTFEVLMAIGMLPRVYFDRLVVSGAALPVRRPRIELKSPERRHRRRWPQVEGELW